MPYQVVRGFLAVVRCPNEFFSTAFNWASQNLRVRQSLPLKYDLGAEMYLVRHVRGTASELGLKQLFRLLRNTLGMQNKIPLKSQLDQSWR